MAEKKDENKVDTSKTLLLRLFEFQAENVHIPKSKKAYGYYYADLDSIIEIVTPYLQKHRIGYLHWITQYDNDKQACVHSALFNPDNPDDRILCKNFVDDEVKLSGMNKFMVAGSAVTYFRRYHLVSMLGLTTDQDTDVGGAEQSKQNTTSKKPAGRSVNTAKQESAVDYVKIFDNLISKGKSFEQLNKMFDKYKKNMNADDLKSIKEKIDKSSKLEKK